MKYAIWRSCERMNIRPPDMVKGSYDELEAWPQANIIAYNQIREIEEMDIIKATAGVK